MNRPKLLLKPAPTVLALPTQLKLSKDWNYEFYLGSR